MNVEFYCGNNLIGMWGVVSNNIKELLDKFGNSFDKNIISNPDDFFDAALEWRNGGKLACEKEIYRQILNFTHSYSTIEENDKYLKRFIENTIINFEDFDSIFDKIDSLYYLYDFYSKDNDNNTFWFRYVKD